MRSLLSTTALIGAALAGAVLFGGGDASSQDAPEASRIAFLDLAEVVRKYDKSSRIDEELEKERLRYDQEYRKALNELNKKKADLEVMERGTEEYREKREEIAREGFLLDYRKKESERKLRDSRTRMMLMIYTEIKNEAATLALNKGYQAVMLANDAAIVARAPEEVPALISLRTVIYWDKSLDITDEILEILNGK
ncbi:MAG: OmpH/Skp family outer membrane protein [Planctomycetota bacterium]|jgi:Skp family chaperone for outer membrane proteins